MLLRLITDWATIYASVALTEHFVFRGGFAGYVPEDYNNPSKLPRGFAAIFSLALGAIGVAMGMTQTWYNGPLSTHGDIGWELGCSFSIIGLLIARPIELRYFKR
jgi:purine-cytosine permease-like protein